MGAAGFLRCKDGEYVFPFPTKIDGQKIIGETYEIELNEGWKVEKINDKGDLEVVRDRGKKKGTMNAGEGAKNEQ